MAKTDLTAQRLRELLHYDPETGVFTRLKRVSNAAVGAVAGTRHSGGYLEITIDYQRYYSHRLAWMYVHGVFPNGLIDHIDGVRTNNRIQNLREVDYFGNAHNVRKRSDATSSKHLGVCWCKNTKRWKAQIRAFNTSRLIGFFDDQKSASEAYQEAKKTLHLAAS